MSALTTDAATLSTAAGYASRIPTLPETLDEARARAQAQADAGPSFFGAFRDAARSEWVTAFASNQIERGSIRPDPTFRLTPDMVKRYGDGLEPDLLDGFGDVQSESELSLLAEQRRGVMESRQRLASLGWTGAGLRIGAGILDPGLLAATAATGGLGTSFTYGGRVARLSSFVRGGLVAGATVGATESYLASQDPERGLSDVLIATGGGFVLGGGLHALADPRFASAGRKLAKQNVLAEIKASGLELTEKGRALFKDVENPELASEAIAKRIVADAANYLPPEAVDDLKARAGISGAEPARSYFTRAAIEDKLSSAFADTGMSQADAVEGLDNVNVNASSLRFYKKLPDEVRSFIEGNPWARRIFTVTDTPANAGGWDALTELGDEAYFKLAEQLGRREIPRALEFAKSHPDPQLNFLAALYENLPKRGDRAAQVAVPPEALPVGAHFEIHGEKFRVVETADGPTLRDGDVYPDTPVFALERVPVDTGTLTGAEVPKVVGVAATESPAAMRQAPVDQAPSVGVDGPSAGGGVPAAPGAIAPEVIDFGGVSDARAAMSGVRFGMAGRLGASDVPEVRRLGTMLAEDVLIKADGTPPIESASEAVQRIYSTTMAKYNRTVNEAFERYAETRGGGLLHPVQRMRLRDEFEKAVGIAARHERGIFADEAVNTAADSFREGQRAMLKMGKAYGVKGFENLTERDTYVTRIYNRNAIIAAIDRLGSAQVYDVFANAILRKSEEVTAEQARMIAKGHVRTILDSGKYPAVEKAMSLGGSRAALLEQGLRDTVPGITDQQIADLLHSVRPRSSPDAGLIPRAMKRLGLDEGYVGKVTAKDGTVGELAISDLLENNASAIMGLYSRQVIGESVMQSVYRAMSKNAGETIDTADKLLAFVKSKMVADGVGARDFRWTMNRLETLVNHVRGLPLNDDGTFSSVARSVRDINYLSRGGSFGVNQVFETGLALTQVGLPAAMKQMPGLRTIIDTIRNGGRLSNELQRELEVTIGLGTGQLNSKLATELGGITETVGEAAGGAIRQTLQRGRMVQSNVSLLAPLTALSERWMAASAAQKWADFARSGKLPTAKRLAAMGLHPEDAPAILAELKANGTFERGMFRGWKLTALNLDKWDLDTAAKFKTSLDKSVRRWIQTNDIGQLSQWMTTEWGKTLLQFRTFPTVAYEKQLLFNLQQRDLQAGTYFLAATALGALHSAFYTYVRTIGNPDADRIRREQLSPDRLALAAFARAGFSSLAPSVIDGLADNLGYEKPFTKFRTSGLEGDPIWGNPTFDLVVNAPRGLFGAMRAPFDRNYDLSRDDLRKLRAVIPFQSVPGIRNYLDALGAELPRKSQPDPYGR